ncbi:MAG: lipopolysaccharide biosynthesis protein [Crocinitomicaceae bacterium]|nr:lipopolysaccharide biosynthesis protein [Crocinitomicaceae bacterium]
MYKLIKRYQESDFFRNALKLISGTMIAQIISYAISPVISRIYSTEEMGDFGLYSRIIAFISAVAMARFELSLPLPKNDSHSYLLFRLALKIALYTFGISSIIGGVYLLLNPFSYALFFFVLITLVSSIFIIIISLGTNWAIRKKNFSVISRSRISNSLFSNGFRLIFGLLGFGSIGLLLSSLGGYILSSIGFVKIFVTDRVFFRKYKSKKKTFVLVTEYKDLPLINLPHVLTDLGRDLLIAFLIVYSFGKDYFGSYTYSVMILSLPIALIGQAIGQVFFNKCSELINSGSSVYLLLKRTLIILSLSAILPFTILFFFGKEIFSFIFGSNWALAGYFSEILAVGTFFNFIISPLSNLPIVLKKQKQYFILGLISTLTQIFIIGILPMFIGKTDQSFIIIMWSMSLSQAILLIITTFIFLNYAKDK